MLNCPKKAQAFIEKHFKDAGVMKCEKYFAKGKYEVECAMASILNSTQRVI
ncbi:hypothetical protein [Duncaniella dubosii]|uniref:hypothetical protein n=1 Tax=Duncaniella dubosii TaxID=2518971 RepID=UPI003F66F7B7